jgi:hypothetical protein
MGNTSSKDVEQDVWNYATGGVFGMFKGKDKSIDKNIGTNTDLYRDYMKIKPEISSESKLAIEVKKILPDSMVGIVDLVEWIGNHIWTVVFVAAGFIFYPFLEPFFSVIAPYFGEGLGYLLILPFKTIIDIIDDIALIVIPPEYLSIGRLVIIEIFLEVCYYFNGLGGLWAKIFKETDGSKTGIAKFGHLLSNIISYIFSLLSTVIGLMSSSVAQELDWIGSYVSTIFDLIFGNIIST